MKNNDFSDDDFAVWVSIKREFNKFWKGLTSKLPGWAIFIVATFIVIMGFIGFKFFSKFIDSKTDQVLSSKDAKQTEYLKNITPTPAPDFSGCNTEWTICSNFNDGKWKGKEKFVVQNPEDYTILSAPIKGNTGAMMYYEEKIVPNNEFLLKAKPLGETYFGLVLFEYGHTIRCILGDGDRRVIRCFTLIENEWIKKIQGYLPQGETILPGTEIEVNIDIKLISNNTLSIKIDLTYIFNKNTSSKMFSLNGEIPLPILLNKTEKREIGVGLVDPQRKRDIEVEFIQFNIRE